MRKFTALKKLVNINVRDIARDASFAIILKVIGAVLAFAFNVAVARLLGANGTGIYFLALSIVTMSSVVARFGFDQTLLKLVSKHSTEKDVVMVNSVYYRCISVTFVLAGSLSLLAYFLSPWFANVVFGKPLLIEPLRWMSLSILPFSLINLTAESLKGIKVIKKAMFLQSVGIPLICILLIFPFTKWLSVEGAALVYLIATIFMALVGLLFWHDFKLKLRPYEKYSFQTVLISAKELFVSSLMNRAILPWAPIFILGIYVDASEVGIFSACFKLAMLMTFLLAAVNNVLAPKFTELFLKNKMQELETTVRHSALLIFLLTSPLFILFFFNAEFVTGIFGDEFKRGAEVLIVLSLGQLINALTGSVGIVLLVTGNEVTLRKISVRFALLQLALCFVLIPVFGVLGAAIATAIVIAGNNISSVYYIYKILKINTFPVRIGL